MVKATHPETFTSTNHTSVAHTSAMIEDGAIVNADVNASAAIAQSKLVAIAASDLPYTLGGAGATGELPLLFRFPIGGGRAASTTSTSYTDWNVWQIYPPTLPTLTNTTQRAKLMALLGHRSNTGTTYAQLYDKTDSAAVTNSEISYTSTTAYYMTLKESSAISLDPAHRYIMQLKVSGGTGDVVLPCIMVYAELK